MCGDKGTYLKVQKKIEKKKYIYKYFHKMLTGFWNEKSRGLRLFLISFLTNISPQDEDFRKVISGFWVLQSIVQYGEASPHKKPCAILFTKLVIGGIHAVT